MNEKKKLCPYKKLVERDYDGIAGKATIRERFACCAGERCMAYYQIDSKEMCRRLAGEEA